MGERDENGRFTKGYKGGPGRPKKEREDKFHEITLTTVTFEDWKAVVRKAVDQAKRGDQQARKWLSDYLIGPPVQRQEVTGADGGPVQTEDVTMDNDERADRITAILDRARARRAGQADNG
jgi:hypothetical protein